MAYDEGLAEGIRSPLGAYPAISEKHMFGGWHSYTKGT
ncbi:hypothetical protein M2158_004727 [Streptomyces sp. SAI-144]|jgi:hypothetical protein|nr:hypothetical protein [Streptomyces sp. SAI-144]MDH6493477.1 hypothetical protein [Streptomyces sp. SAI-127]